MKQRKTDKILVVNDFQKLEEDWLWAVMVDLQAQDCFYNQEISYGHQENVIILFWCFFTLILLLYFENAVFILDYCHNGNAYTGFHRHSVSGSFPPPVVILNDGGRNEY